MKPSSSSPADHASHSFESRHIGPGPGDITRMLGVIGVPSLDALVDVVVPADIRRSDRLEVNDAESEYAYLERLRRIAGRNQMRRSYIGLGYYGTVTPPVIQRNVFENPGWYTPYTPYQAEIAQGRLESLLNFQTMVSDLTGMDVANASLLDEATAAAEAVGLLLRVKKGSSEPAFFVATNIFPQVRAVVLERARLLGVRVVEGDPLTTDLPAGLAGAYVQSPDDCGRVLDIDRIAARVHEAGGLLAVGTDLLALTLITPPGEAGADVVVGSAQRFGVPLGYGGPHAAFFATRTAYVRQLPGRLIGVSVDAQGRRAYRMAIQTREQHIRREKATSNICTAQALLANMAAFYAVYHGPDGLRALASRIHDQTARLAQWLVSNGWYQRNEVYFDTLCLEGTVEQVSAVKRAAEQRGINLRYRSETCVQISLDETVSETDLADVAGLCAAGSDLVSQPLANPGSQSAVPDAWRRTSPFLTHPVFGMHHSETEMMRYIRALERKDLGLDSAMIPLGSCTMKLNAAAEMMPVSWPEFSRLHPFAPADQADGYQQVFEELTTALASVTGLPGVSLQPNSGAQGEFAGLLVIRAYHDARGDSRRTVALIPQSAHGTNPASAALAGFTVVIVACDAQGNIDVDDLRAKAAKHHEQLACLMVTYPSTHGVFETRIREICALVHEHGGQVYMDGANMNAQVGLTSPAAIGADVCHLNLHKTFAIPHGGGGPGMGPIAVASHLMPFLPGHPLVATGGARGIAPVAAAPWGSASILLISYGYIRMLGASGLRRATEVAILNANYIRARLAPHYPVLYTGPGGYVAHELIFDLRPFKAATGIDEMDVAKRLIDFGFHAPTVSFPVPGTIMVEPTESEPLEELDRFCEAMIAIRAEIEAVASGRLDRADNPLKHAPHTAEDVCATTWPHAYSREQAAYPVPGLRARKFWPPVSRVDNPYGDRTLVFACPPVDAYADSGTR
jgi:glycine dehydrogenase